MSLIVAARFQTFDEATEAAQRLRLEGFSEDELHTFYINTAGEHARFPLGGTASRIRMPAARTWRAGGRRGAGVATGVGRRPGGPVVGRRDAGGDRGGRRGSLYRRPGRRVAGGGQEPPAPGKDCARIRRGASGPETGRGDAGVARIPEREAVARRVLREAGGHDIERAQGRWQDGKWQDFDPLKPPRHVEAPSVAP